MAKTKKKKIFSFFCYLPGRGGNHPVRCQRKQEDLKSGSAICLRKINSFYPSLQISLLLLRELIAYGEDLTARELQNPEKHLE